MLEITTGDPVILDVSKGMQKYMLFKGCRGTCNALQVVDDVEYLCFMPDGQHKMYWMESSRFILDEERMNA